MSVRQAVSALALLLCAVAAQAADMRPEIVVHGRTSSIDVSPAGALWIVTATGEAWRSDDGARTWSEAPLPSRKIDSENFFGDSLDRVTFFDAAHAMISGYIGKEQDAVFLTSDGGTTWRSARLPDSLWVYDARAMSDGHAWLVGSEGQVLRSEDFGATWKKLRRPFEEGERTNAVDFRSADEGVVGAISGGALVTTNDGGATWTAFHADGEAAILRGCGEHDDHRVTRVRLTATKLFIAQCGGIFASPLAAPRAWTRITAGGQPLTAFDLAADGDVIGVAADLRVYRIAADGEAREIGGPLERQPMAIATAGKFIAAVDPTLKVAFHDGVGWYSSRMFGKGIATSWPIAALDRGKNDVLWGVSQFFLYRSVDGATSWERVAELPRAAAGVAAQENGDVLLWNGHGWVGRWNLATASLTDVPGLSGLDVVGSFRRRDLWLVYGGRQYDTQRRIEVARTYFSGQFQGSVDYGFVAASTDGGATWTTIDRWTEGPQRLFLSDDNHLTLVSWLGSIRRGTVTLQPPAAAMRTIVDAQENKSAPYAENVFLLDFLRPNDAWIGGWIHHLGNVWFRSTDGGRTWAPADGRKHPMEMLLRLYDGRWIGISSTLGIQLWNGSRFEALAPWPAETTGAWVDGTGGLTIRLKGGSLRVLEGRVLRDPRKR